MVRMEGAVRTAVVVTDEDGGGGGETQCDCRYWERRRG
jgi:hypothetical protein